MFHHEEVASQAGHCNYTLIWVGPTYFSFVQRNMVFLMSQQAAEAHLSTHLCYTTTESLPTNCVQHTTTNSYTNHSNLAQFNFISLSVLSRNPSPGNQILPCNTVKDKCWLLSGLFQCQEITSTFWLIYWNGIHCQTKAYWQKTVSWVYWFRKEVLLWSYSYKG